MLRRAARVSEALAFGRFRTAERNDRAYCAVSRRQPLVCVQVLGGSRSQSVGVPPQAALQPQPCVVQVSASSSSQSVGVPVQLVEPQ